MFKYDLDFIIKLTKLITIKSTIDQLDFLNLDQLI